MGEKKDPSDRYIEGSMWLNWKKIRVKAVSIVQFSVELCYVTLVILQTTLQLSYASIVALSS